MAVKLKIPRRVEVAAGREKHVKCTSKSTLSVMRLRGLGYVWRFSQPYTACFKFHRTGKIVLRLKSETFFVNELEGN